MSRGALLAVIFIVIIFCIISVFLLKNFALFCIGMCIFIVLKELYEHRFDRAYAGERVSKRRINYEKKLREYYNNHKPRTNLTNEYCEANLITENGNVSYFYVKNKTDQKSGNVFFEVKGNTIHVATMWAIFDMEFKANTRYEDLLSLYKDLNNNFNFLYEYDYETFDNKQNIQQSEIQNPRQNISIKPVIKPFNELNPEDKFDERNIDL